MQSLLRQFSVSIVLTMVAVIGAWILLGFGAAVTTAILIALEVVFSFDNAVINAKTLVRMSRVWQLVFLTVGIVVAVIGMRLVFPIVIVSLTASLGWRDVLDLALNNPHQYAHYLAAAHIAISSFGGGFLLLLTLYFFLDDEREILWLHRLERPLQKIGGKLWLPPVVALVVIGVVGALAPAHAAVWRGGITGVVAYTAIHLLIAGLGRATGDDKTAKYAGWGALIAFVYLEILDASFSFDGVLGAFAITNSVPLIAIGLGVGALWVRSLTVFMVRNGTLEAFRYLEHGAHYAILALSLALLYSIFHEVPEVVTGTVGIAIILASVISSRQFNAARPLSSK
ncbi:MAG: hypothetical protein JWN38_452 [Candidatus Saccharibacteria bacterium]|nr:hypothetical protein [Candidatus Saccharibacteria bacterium]